MVDCNPKVDDTAGAGCFRPALVTGRVAAIK